jgi:hypothetical protein
MQFYYGTLMPLRILDEGEFWKHQETEHTEVIRALAKDLEPRFVSALQEWEQAFSRTHGAFVRYIEWVGRLNQPIDSALSQQIYHLVNHALQESEQFIHFLDYLGKESVVIHNNPTAITVLNHIRRESEYFIGISHAILSNAL